MYFLAELLLCIGTAYEVKHDLFTSEVDQKIWKLKQDEMKHKKKEKISKVFLNIKLSQITLKPILYE